MNSKIDDSAAAIIGRMKHCLGVFSDSKLAAELGVSPSAVCLWRKSEAVPAGKVVMVGRRTGVSLDWLFMGERHDGPAERHREDMAQAKVALAEGRKLNPETVTRRLIDMVAGQERELNLLRDLIDQAIVRDVSLSDFREALKLLKVDANAERADVHLWRFTDREIIHAAGERRYVRRGGSNA